MKTSAGVLNGSNVSPLLFKIFIDYLNEEVKKILIKVTEDIKWGSINILKVKNKFSHNRLEV